MSTYTNREATRCNPCKKQAPPFFTTQTTAKSHEHITSGLNTNNVQILNSDVTLYPHSLNHSISSLSMSSREGSIQHATEPETTIESILRRNSYPVSKAELPQTSRSHKVQSKMSSYFKSIAVNPHPSTVYRPTLASGFLPSQSMFRLRSTITHTKSNHPLAASSNSSRNTNHSRNSPTSPLRASTSFPTSPFHSSSNASSKSILSSSSASTNIKKTIRSAQPDEISLCKEHSSQSKSSISTTEKVMRLDEYQYSLQDSHQTSSSASTCASKDSSFQPSFHNTTVDPDQQIRRSLRRSNLIPSQVVFSSHSSSDSSTQSHNPIHHTMSPEDIEKLSQLYQDLEASTQRFASLQTEYTARKQYIDAQIEELSKNEGDSASMIAPSSIHLAQSLQSQSSLNTSSESSTTLSLSSSSTDKLPQICRANHTSKNHSQQISKFRYLNYAGSKDEDTFRSSCTSSVTSDQSSATRKPESQSNLPEDWYEEDTSSISSASPQNSPRQARPSALMLGPVKFLTSSSDISSSSSQIESEQECSKSEVPVPHSIPPPCSSPKSSSALPPPSGDARSPSSTPSVSSQCSETEPASPLESQSVVSSILSVPTARDPRLITPSTLEHEYSKTKSSTSIRIIGQNCRGIYHKGESPSEHFVPSMESFQSFGADMILLSETNTDWRINDNFYDTKLRNKAIWNPSPTMTSVASCPWDNTTKRSYQPGGLMSVSLNNLPSRIKKTIKDPLGRFIKTVFQGKAMNVTIYNIYRPNHMSLANAGIDTIWMQQWQQLKDKYPRKCDPRKICIEDLITSIQKGHESNEIPIIIGDFNEDITKDKGFGIRDLMHRTDTIQIFQNIHGHIPSSRGNNRSVYHILISKHLRPFVDKIGVLQSNHGFHHSDHVPFFIDLNQEVFDCPSNPIVPPDLRKLKMHDAKSVENYICYVKDQFDHHNIIQRTINLRTYVKNVSFDILARTELEKLDAQVTDIRLRSENRLHPDPSKFKHTSKMSMMVEKIRTLQSMLRYQSQGRAVPSKIIHHQRKLDIDDHLVSEESVTTDSIAAMKQDLKFLQEEEEVIREDHLNECYDKAVEIEDKNKARIVKEIKEREKQRRSWNKIHFVTKSNNHSGIDRLGIPTGYEHKSTQETWGLF